MSTFIQPKFSFDCFDPDGEFDEARLQRPIAGEHSGYHRAPEVDADELRIRLPSDLHLLDVEVFRGKTYLFFANPTLSRKERTEIREALSGVVPAPLEIVDADHSNVFELEHPRGSHRNYGVSYGPPLPDTSSIVRAVLPQELWIVRVRDLPSSVEVQYARPGITEEILKIYKSDLEHEFPGKQVKFKLIRNYDRLRKELHQSCPDGVEILEIQFYQSQEHELTGIAPRIIVREDRLEALRDWVSEYERNWDMPITPLVRILSDQFTNVIGRAITNNGKVCSTTAVKRELAALSAAPDTSSQRKVILKLPRTDHTHRAVCKIDPEGSQDCDDAWFIERVSDGLLVSTYIAQPQIFLGIDQEEILLAHKRGYTDYYHDLMRTVLPRDLALWHASLLPGEARPALMLPWHISFSGEVSLLPLECATIKVQHPLTAQDASLALKDSKHLAHEQIALTNQVVQMLGNKAIDEQGWSLLDEDASNGHNMVARLMVTTNHLVGEFMHTQHPEIAFPYRVFEGSQEHIANDVLREAMAEHWSQVWERASQDPAHLMRKLQFMDLVAGKSSFKRSVSALLDRACYSLLPLGHKAVQDGDTPLLYAHVTSPLRRFMDFVAGYQIIAAHYGRPPIEREVMQSYANMASWTGRLQKSRALELGLLANFENITEKIGRTYDAKLLSTNKRQAVFQVCDFGRITVKLSAKQHVGNSTHKVIQDRTGNVLYSVGDIVSLRLSSWDFIANRPVFNLY